ncbi:MAG: hypothetical protein KDC87_16915 [Planctomycetes bacterium]|nr:hypothetical protein [Planctomycetota bacterium]MCB9870998.1 hypothetical protein [Planctomycetota bacterium]
MARVQLWVWIAVAAAVALYARSLACGFTYDDADQVRVPSLSTGHPNPYIAEVQPLEVYFSTSYTASHGGHGRGFRPLTNLSFALVHAATKHERPTPGSPAAPAWPQHLVNVLLHAFATWLTFRLLALLFGAGPPAVLGTAVFGLHALRSDPVISIVGRGELLAYVFGLLALFAYLAGLRAHGGARWLRLGAAAVAVFCALGSKESAAPWVVFLPLMVWVARRRDASLPTLQQQLGPWTIAAALPLAVFSFLLVRVWLGLPQKFEPSYVSNPLWYQPATVRIASALVVLGHAALLVLAPFSLSHDYSAMVFPLVDLASPRAWLSAAALLGLLLASIWRLRRDPALFAGAAMWFGFTFITSNIPFSIETVFGERLLYTPATALSIAVAWAIHRCGARAGRILAGITLLWLTASAACIVTRTFAWTDNQTLFDTDVGHQPRSIRIRMARMQFLRFGDPATWHREILAAHELDHTAPGPLLELSFFHNAMGAYAEAEASARAGLASPHVDVRDNRARFELELGKAIAGQGRWDEAERVLRSAVARADREAGAPEPRTRMALVQVLLDAGRQPAAKRELRQLTSQVPAFLPAWDERLLLAQAERHDGDVQTLLAEAEQLFPGATQWVLHRALLAARRGDAAGALQVFAREMPRLPMLAETAGYWEQYAVLLNRQGRSDVAVRVLRDLTRLPGMRASLRHRLAESATRLEQGRAR